MGIIWKDVVGFEGLYKVSNDGRVIGNETIYYCGYKKQTKRVLKEREIVGDTDRLGHRRVTLYHDGNKKRIFIHRLVAEAFIPNPENKPEIDHINTNTSDNRVENLRWVTHKENQNNPITKVKQKTAQIGEKNFWFGKKGVLHHASKRVRCVETGKVYGGVAEAERITGIRHIGCCCRGVRNTAGGLCWKFI